jgi:hypothetical protein
MRSIFYAAGMALAVNAAHADPLPEADVRAAMSKVETALAGLGIDVAGYAASAAPQAELAPPAHLYLQGNAGAYVDGRVYINAEDVEGCRDLTLVHELVHDATVKHRLFAAVPNGRLRAVIEALADAVTAAAAEDPYRPGCVTARAIAVSSADLTRLAHATP